MTSILQVVLCALTLFPLANRSAGLKMDHVQWAEEPGPPEYNMIMKTPARVQDNLVRFVFFAGLGGSGHHGWQAVMQGEKLCEQHVQAETHLRNLWYGEDSLADVSYTLLKNEFVSTVQRTKDKAKLYCLNVMVETMMSYPDQNSKIHHPDLISLTRAAAETAVDLRIVVMHRDPAPSLVSLSLHRGFISAPEEAQQMGNQAAILSAQLQSIDSSFYMCTAYTDVYDQAETLAQWLVGDFDYIPVGLFSLAIRKHYRDAIDDVKGAHLEIGRNAPLVQVKMDTWQALHGVLLRTCER